MKVQDLQREISRTTGDSIRTIKRLGFQLKQINPTASLEMSNSVQNPVRQIQNAELASTAPHCEVLLQLAKS